MGVFEIIIVIIETSIMLFYCSSVFEKKELNRYIKIGIIAAAIATSSFTGAQRLGTAVNLTISCCMCFLLLCLLYKGIVKTKLFISVIYVVVIIFSDFLAVIFITFFGIEYKMVVGDNITYIVGAMLSCFIRLWLLAYVGKILSRRIQKLPIAYWIFLFICPVLSITCLIIFDIYLMQAEAVNRLLVFIPSFCILYINFMLFGFFETFSEQIRLKVVEELAKSEEENYKILQNNEEELRKLRHDMKNHIMMLNEYLKQGNTETALQHLSSIQNTLQEISAVVYTNNPPIDAAINIGGRKAQTEGIEYKVQIIGDETVNIDAGDICKFLSNAIDNAIEGSDECEERYVYIEIKISNDDLKIHIENPTLNSRENILKSLTRKQDKKNHGYGMKNMQGVVKKYNGTITTEVNDGVFCLDTILHNTSGKI